MIPNHPKACVIGWPISHSRSPLIHGHWLKKHGISGSYERMPVAPGDLRAFFERIRTGELVGCNVTLPHKHAALAFVDAADDRATRIGALNTVWKDGHRVCATSTDGPGFFQNVTSSVTNFSPDGPATILGAGGSARAIIDELLRQGADEVNVNNRTHSRAIELADQFGPKVRAVQFQEFAQALKRTHLLVNTTSAGISDAERLSMDWDLLNPRAIVTDINYVPLVTPFLAQAKARNHLIITGLGMLLHQAVIGFEKWFGIRPSVTTELYNLVARDIDPGFSP